jgi:hypothetical protein
MKRVAFHSEKMLLTAISFSVAITCRAVVLDFDSPPLAPGDQDSYGSGQGYLEDGFRITSTGGSGSIIRFKPPNPFSTLPDNGTVHFGATYDSYPMLDRPDGQLFSFAQIDLAHYSDSFIRDRISLRGDRVDGTSVNVELQLPSSFDPMFHTFQLNASWTDLRRVSFLTDGFAWDNIVVTAIPEPGSVTLGCLGVLLLSASTCRRYRRIDCVDGIEHKQVSTEVYESERLFETYATTSPINTEKTAPED